MVKIACSTFFIIQEIEAIFDTISYKKGSAIIHMLESYMGIEDLRQGLKIYLNKHKFKNAVTKDLWEALAAATNNTKDIEVKLFDSSPNL